MTTRYKGTKSEIVALDAFIKLLRCANSAGQSALKAIQAANLTETQFGVLEALHHLGPMTQSKLAEKLLKSGGNITLVIENLVRQQLVYKQRGEDRRCYLIELTDKGKKLIADIFPGHVQNISAFFSVLSYDDQIKLADLCKKLGKQISNKSGGIT